MKNFSITTCTYQETQMYYSMRRFLIQNFTDMTHFDGSMFRVSILSTFLDSFLTLKYSNEENTENE